MARHRPGDPALPLRHLAAAVSHEIRNPLNAMAIHAELLESRVARAPTTEAEPLRRSIDLLRQEIDRIDDLLATYLRVAGPTDEARAPCSLRDLSQETVERNGAAAALREVPIRMTIENPSLRWHVDRAAMGVALDALVLNAIEASGSGDEIVIRAREADEEIAWELSDRGAGIDPIDLPRIFGLGFSTKRRRHGVGLTVAKQVVKLNGGSIEVHPAARGTTVRITLPSSA